MSVLTKRKRGRPRLDESREINDFDANLVEAVKKFPIFYDKNHPNYRNREYTERIWDNVADSLNVSANVVKNRMFQLRNRYNVEKRRVVTTRGVTSNWPLFDSLQYLSEFNENRLHCSLPTKLSDNAARAMSSSESDEDVEEDEGKNEIRTCERNGYITSDNIDIAQQSDLLQSPQPAKEETTQMENEQYMKKFEAFGQFLASSLIELNEMQALHLVKKFTTDLVEYSKLGEGKKALRTNMQHSLPSGEEEHSPKN